MALAHRLSGIIRVATRWLRIISTNYVSYVLIFPPLLRFSGGDVQISGGPWASCRILSVGDEHRLLAHIRQWG